MAKECLAGCIADYECGVLQTPGPAGEQGESFAPWVKVQLIADQQTITVGNKSYPTDPHTAIIKSFEIGWISTPTLVVEIVDEAGGRMGALVDSLKKCAPMVKTGNRMKVQWGWIVTDCFGQKKTIKSLPVESNLATLEVSYMEGKIKYKVTGTNEGVPTDSMREDYLIGTDDKRVPLEDAIRELYARPPAINVLFCEVTKDGNLKKGVKLKWKGFKEGGPREVWQADNQSRDAVVRKWIDPFRIDDGTVWGKGLNLRDDVVNPNEKLIIVDPTPNPGEAKDCSNSSLGTFIVNGGKCSPVIEFSPTFNWVGGFSNFSAGGGTAGPGGTDSVYSEDYAVEEQSKDHAPTAGLQTQTAMTQQSWNAYGPQNAYSETMRSQQAHLKSFNLDGGIQAELRILGDPRQPFVGVINGKTVSIVAINPFHIQQNFNGGCGEWLAIPGCNEILSNRMWLVQGVNHSIKEGSYTTTLKLELAPPGLQQGKNEPVGGSGSGGPTVKNVCP